METHGEICKFSAGNTEARISLISSKHSVQKLGHFRPWKLNSVHMDLSIYLSNRDKLKFSRCDKRIEIHSRDRERFKTSLTNGFEFRVWFGRNVKRVQKNSRLKNRSFDIEKEISIDTEFIRTHTFPRKSETSKKLGPSRQRNPLRHGWQKAREGWKWSTRAHRADIPQPDHEYIRMAGSPSFACPRERASSIRLIG